MSVAAIRQALARLELRRHERVVALLRSIPKGLSKDQRQAVEDEIQFRLSMIDYNRNVVKSQGTRVGYERRTKGINHQQEAP